MMIMLIVSAVTVSFKRNYDLKMVLFIISFLFFLFFCFLVVVIVVVVVVLTLAFIFL